MRSHAHQLDAGPSSLDPLLEAIGDAPIVLLGEGTHGTAEFYQIRQQITRRLIREKSFNFVAIEGDWPDAYRVNQFVRGEAGTPRDALAGFGRFPRWMWANRELLSFVTWLRQHNDRVGDPRKKVGFYGLDLYSLFASMASVIVYLEVSRGG